MRESAFDISFRFGPYGAATHHFAPVCLNSLLYKTEKDLEAISLLLGKTAEAGQWKQRAEQRKQQIEQISLGRSARNVSLTTTFAPEPDRPTNT